MKYAILAVTITASVFSFIQPVFAQEQGKLTLETGVNYNTGKYGGTQSTDILYIPFTGKYRDGPWTVKVTVPYLQISGPINVINGVGQTTTTTTASSTRSGMGDVIAAVSNNVYWDASSGLLVNLGGEVKLGTASSAQGLGTGKNDYAVRTGVYQVNKRLTTFGRLGYRVYGQPAGYTLDNGFFGSLGGSYKFDQDTNGGILLSLGQKITATGSSRVETLFFVDHKIEKTWKVQGYMLKGYTNSVPNWGAGAMVFYML